MGPKAAPAKSAKKTTTSKAAAPAKAAGEKRTPSPYILFCSEKRPELKNSHPNATFGEMGKLLGQMWGALSDSQKAAYKR